MDPTGGGVASQPTGRRLDESFSFRIGRALALSATYAAAVQAFDCTLPKHHCIKVTVDEDTNKLVVDADPLTKKGPGHFIHWILDDEPSQSYTFPANGIAFSTSDGGADEFANCGPDPGNARVFHCESPKGEKGNYKYTITVVGIPKPSPLDPHVINN